MMFFSDKENCSDTPCYTENISISVWNGIYSVLEKLKAKQGLSISFPEFCPDSLSVICGIDERKFLSAVSANIPKLDWSIGYLSDSYSEFNEILGNEPLKLNTFAILDFIEFIYHNITDTKKIGDYHSFFNHSHYVEVKTSQNRDWFREEINTIFRRNNIGFILDNNGCVQRQLSAAMASLIKGEIDTEDNILNSYINNTSVIF